MAKNTLLENLEQLLNKFNKPGNESYEPLLKIENSLEEYLELNPNDTQLWFKLSLVVYRLHDDLKAIECLKSILKYDPNNDYAIIMLAYMSDIVSGMTDDQYIVEKLFQFQTSDKSIMSMIEYMKSKYYFSRNNEKMRQHALKESIDLHEGFVWNYVKLASVYIDNKEILTAQKLLIRALSNIKRIYDPPQDLRYDFMSLESFIHEHITGIWINNIQYNHILAMLCNFTLDRC